MKDYGENPDTCNGQHFFARRMNGIWRCLCGERRDSYGKPINLKVI